MTPNQLIQFVRDIYRTNDFIPLHAPSFEGNEKAYVLDTIDSTFVSSVGQYVSQFEQQIADYTNSPYAIATVNGTTALHAALYMSDVKAGDLVITQSLTFVATCNAIHQLGAQPLFIDVSPMSLGLCPKSVSDYLEEHAVLTDQGCFHKTTKQPMKAILPMHTFGHPCQMNELLQVCQDWHLTLIEDAAESLGSLYNDRHTGTLGRFGILSFNGNKIITTGGGGMILCSDQADGEHTKHVTTTAKSPHAYEFYHDEPAFNYRMPNLNAALGCAQMESLESFISSKRLLADQYKAFFQGASFEFITEPNYARSNYWLNAVICPDNASRIELLEQTNDAGVMTRPVWQLMHKLPMYAHALRGELPYSEFLEARLVNLPSSPMPI